MAVDYEDLFLAFDFVSSAPPRQNEAYIDRDTGRIYWVSGMETLEEEEVPDDLGEDDRYIAIPHKTDLDLGRVLALRFAREELPDLVDRIRGFFRRRGAYARFKVLLADHTRLEKWYAYAEASTKRALEEWCALNEIELQPEPSRGAISDATGDSGD